MSRELLILRHAESGWGAASDFERTLTEKGGHDAAQMGAWIHESELLPDYILASPAQRAKETVRAVCGALGVDAGEVHWEPRIYEASVDTLMELLQGLPESAERILMVGHNPGLVELIFKLSGEAPAGFSPANLAWLLLDQVEPRGAQLKQWVQPPL